MVGLACTVTPATPPGTNIKRSMVLARKTLRRRRSNRRRRRPPPLQRLPKPVVVVLGQKRRAFLQGYLGRTLEGSAQPRPRAPPPPSSKVRLGVHRRIHLRVQLRVHRRS